MSGPTIQITGLRGLPEVHPGDDLVALIAPASTAAGVRDDDVIVVTSKIVSKAEGRLSVGEDRSAAIEAETRRVLARRNDTVITETRHGFVCANAGVDASNVERGTVALLPVDPDGSAERLRAGLVERTGARVAVVISDTFGRAWRTGLVNVAIGCAGLPAIADLRGRLDHHGRSLEATAVALADEVAAASGLVMAKNARVPVALVRGVDRLGAPEGRAADLIRPPEEDLFRTSPLEAVRSADRPLELRPDPVPRSPLEEAIDAAGARHRVTVLEEEASIRRVLDVIGEARGAARPVLIVLWGGEPEGGTEASTDLELSFEAGRAVQAISVASAAVGLATQMISGPLNQRLPEPLEAKGRGVPLGIVAVGLPDGDPSDRPMTTS